jgi:putative polyhydroxyalkanoate system protein
MIVVRKHHTTRAVARAKLDEALAGLLSQFGSDISRESHAWNGDVLEFVIRASGFDVSGQMAVTETDVELQVGLPLLVKPLEGRIQAEVENKLTEYFPG